MEINNIEGRSRGSSFRRRALTLVGVSALTLSGVGAAVFGASQAFAFSGNSISSNPYSIGTVVTGGLSFSASNTAESASGVSYTFGFTVPSNESGSNVTLTGLPDSSTTATSAIVTAGGVTTTEGFAPSTGVVTTSSLSAGESVSIVIDGFTNASSLSGNPYTITAEVAGSVAATTTFSLTASASGPGVSINPTTPSYAGSTATFSNFTGISGNTVYLAVSGGLTFNSVANVSNEYSVTYTTPGSTVQETATVQSSTAGVAITAGGDFVQLTLGTILSSTDTVSVVANGVTNGSAGGPFYGEVTSTAVTAGSASPAAPNPEFNIGLSLGAVSLSVSPNTAGSTNAVYSISFTIPSAVTSTTNPTLTATFADNNGNAVTADSGYAVFDSTNPAVNTSSATGGTSVPLNGVKGGDNVTVSYYGVTNSSNASVTGTVSMTGYTVPVKTNTVSYSAASTTSSAVNVAVSNPVVSGTATYTVSGLVAGGTGVNSLGETIQLDFSTSSTTTDLQSGLVLPTAAVNYTLTDLTNSSSSGISGVSVNNGVQGTTPNSVTLTTSNAITAGDSLEITITGVQNPNAAATNEYVTADNAGTLPLTTSVVAPTVAPTAASTMASGSLVQTGGTIYVIAGGVAYGIPTFSDYQTISNGLGNPAVVQSSTAPTTTGTVAMGTLVQVVGSPQINVVGSNNTYYGFSSVSQFESDGYNFANVIQIPSLGNLTAGSGTAPTAASTMASGSLVQFGGTIYVIAGGVAYGIPTFSDYQTISAALNNQMVVQSSTAPSTTGTPVSGTLVQTIGSPQINVYTSTGTEVGFSTASQFTGDGYSFAKVILLP